MNTIRLHVRGQMGVQILQAATAISVINSDEEPILCVNTGGDLSYDSTNKLQDVFDVNCRIIEIDTIRKTPYWVEGSAKYIFKNRDKIFRWLTPKANISPNPDSIGRLGIHIRGKDKHVASIESYKHLLTIARADRVTHADGPDSLVIYSDDPDLAAKTYPEYTISNQSSIADWIDLYNSDIVYAAPSAFIMSMLIFNPNKRIVFLGDKYCDGPYIGYRHDMLFLRECQAYCKNVTILDA